MGYNGEALFWIITLISPIVVAVNLTAIAAIVRVHEAIKHSPLISLFVLNVMFALLNFTQQQITFPFEELEDEGELLHDDNAALTMGTTLPLCFCYRLHMYLYVAIQLWIVSSGFRSEYQRRKQTKIFLLADIAVWFLSALSTLLYIKYSIQDVFEFVYHYVIVPEGIAYLVAITVSHCSIYRKVQESNKRLRHDQGTVVINMKNRTKRILRIYFLILINYVTFALIPCMAYSIALIVSEETYMDGPISVFTPLMVNIWTISSPLVLFYSYFYKNFKKRLASKLSSPSNLDLQSDQSRQGGGRPLYTISTSRDIDNGHRRSTSKSDVVSN